MPLMAVDPPDLARCVGAQRGVHADARQMRASMTLFAAVPGADRVFGEVPARGYDGEADARTLQGLRQGG